MLVIVQEIKVSWTKKSRGGEGSVQRNTVPEVFILPPVQPVKYDDVLIHQQIRFGESNDFDMPNGELKTEKFEVNTRSEFGCLSLRFKPAQLEIQYKYGWSCTGAPRRDDHPWTRFLDAGQWIQMIYNGRFNSGWESFWTYHKTVFNIALLAQFNPDIFLKQPTHKFTDMADLR